MTISAATALLLLAAGEAPTPPATPEEFTIYNVTPGISGFIAFFVLALVGWLLFRSLVRHVRKVDMAAAQRARAEQRSGGAPAQGSGGAPDQAAAGATAQGSGGAPDQESSGAPDQAAAGANDPSVGPVIDSRATGSDAGPNGTR